MDDRRRGAWLWGTILLMTACGDAPGPEVRLANLAVVPQLDASAGDATMVADRLRVVVRRIETDEIAADVTTGLDASGEGEVTIRVELRDDPEVFTLALQAIQSSDGAVLFAGTSQVTVTALSATSATVTLAAVSSVTDPIGDTFATGLSDTLTVPDLVRLQASVTGTALTLQLDFAQPVVASSVGGPNVVVGLVDFDTDENPQTGSQPQTDAFRMDGGSTGMGADFFLSLSDVDGGAFIIRTDSGTATGTVPLQFAGTRLTVVIPLSLLGGDDGSLRLATVVGTLPEPTDIAPNAGSVGIGSGSRLPAGAVARPLPSVHRSWRARF